MRKMSALIQRFLVSDDGPTAVEYAFMLAMIIAICIASITALGTNSSQQYDEVSNYLT